MIVVDASLMVDVLLRTPDADELIRTLFDPRHSLHCPHLLDVEVAQVIRRYAMMGEIDQARGIAAIEDLLAFPLRRYPHDVLLQRVWELRGNLSAYDAIYVALAEALDAVLLTRDRKLAAAAQHVARVELV